MTLQEKITEIERQLTKLTNNPVKIVWDHPWTDKGSIMLYGHFSGLTIRATYPLTNFMNWSTASLASGLIDRWLHQEAAL